MELLQCLSPHAPFWRPDPSVWVFRGHANDDWKLLASAHRDNAFDAYVLPEKIRSSQTEWIRRSESELWLLKKFSEGLGSAGLSIPIHAPTIERGNETSFGGEPNRDAWPLRGLAQHHGLPTALLDWTGRARNAAYFAAAEGAVDRSDSGHLAVWALRTDLLRYVTRDSFEAEPVVGLPITSSGYHCWLRLVRIAYANNPNMHAQSGLFTSTVGEYVLAVDKFILKLVHSETERLSKAPPTLQPPFMWRFSLPTVEAPRLLRLLSYEGVTGAAMFPGCDGVAKALREQGLWDEPPT